MTETILRRVIHIGFFAILLVPLVVAQSMFFPFITGKAFVFRAIVELMFVAWVGLAIVNPAYRPRWTPITTTSLVFLIIIGIANVFGENPVRSLWSNFERMEGFVTLLHVVAYIFVVGSTIVREKVWNWFLNASLIVSLMLALGGIFEVLNTASASIRIDSTFGNSTYFAVYLLFNIFIALVLAYRTWSHTTLRWLYGISALLLTIALYHTGTRGAIIGILAGLGVAGLTLLIRGHAHPRARRVAGAFVIAAVIVVGIFIAFRDSSFVQNQSTLKRIANISLTDTTTQSRLTLWSSIGWEGFKERPLLGWGQDNFIVVFGKYYDPIMYKQEPWFDRAHNVFVDWAIAGGLFGLLAYLALFGAAFVMIVRSSMTMPEKALFVGMFVAYAVHNMFVFDHLISYVYFAMMLAYLHGYKSPELTQTGKDAHPFVAGGVVAIAVILFWFVNGTSFVRAQTLIDALVASNQKKDSAAALLLFEKTLESGWGTGRAESREQFVQAAIRTLSYAEIKQEDRSLFVSRAIQESADAAIQEPNNTRPLYFLAHMLRAAGQYDESRRVFDQALAINPFRQNFLYEYGQTYLEEKNYDEALKYFARAYEAETENDRAAGFYAAALVYSGHQADADAVLTEHFGTTTIDNPMLLEAYKNNGRYDRIVALLEYRLEHGNLKASDRASIHISLASIYANNVGNRNRAIEETQKAIELYPPFAEQGEKMIEAIQAGRPFQVTQ